MSNNEKIQFVNSRLQLNSFSDFNSQEVVDPTLTFATKSGGKMTITGESSGQNNIISIDSDVKLSNYNAKLKFTGDNASVDLSESNSSTVKLNEDNSSIVFVNESIGPQTISAGRLDREGDENPPRGIKFSHDAQFTIPSGDSTVDVRISDLYDPDANLSYMTNALSAVCRILQFSTSSTTIPGDTDWINYFANRNNENDENKNPPVPSS